MNYFGVDQSSLLGADVLVSLESSSASSRDICEPRVALSCRTIVVLFYRVQYIEEFYKIGLRCSDSILVTIALVMMDLILMGNFLAVLYYNWISLFIHYVVLNIIKICIHLVLSFLLFRDIFVSIKNMKLGIVCSFLIVLYSYPYFLW